MKKTANALDVKNTLPWATGLFLATLPLGMDGVTNGLLAALLLASFFLPGASPWKAVLRHRGMWGALSFLLFCALSITWSGHVAEGTTQLTTKLGLVLIPGLALRIAPLFTPEERRNTIRWWVWGAAATLLLALLWAAFRSMQEGATGYIPPGGTERISFFTYETLSAPFMHPGYLATHLGLALLVVMDSLRKGTGLFSKGHALFLVAFLFVGMVLVQGRVNILALLILLGFMSLAEVTRRRKWSYFLFLLIPALGLGLFANLADDSLKRRYLQVPQFDYDIAAGPEGFNSATYRLAEWKGAAYAIGQHPLLGAGMGNNRQALQDAYKAIGFQVGYERHYNAHNQYLEILLATGILGLFLFLMWWGWSFWQSAQTSPFGAWPMAFMLLCMATESMLERAWGVMLGGAVLGFLVYFFGSWDGTRNKST